MTDPTTATRSIVLVDAEELALLRRLASTVDDELGWPTAKRDWKELRRDVALWRAAAKAAALPAGAGTSAWLETATLDELRRWVAEGTVQCARTAREVDDLRKELQRVGRVADRLLQDLRSALAAPSANGNWGAR